MSKRALNGVYLINPDSIGVRSLLDQALSFLKGTYAHGVGKQQIADFETEVGGLEVFPEPSSKRTFIMRPDHRILGRAANLVERIGEAERRPCTASPGT